MHDPEVLAFSIKRPWPDGKLSSGKPYYPALIDVWHVDPAEDRCGWAYVNVPEADIEWAGKRAEDEWPYWFSSKYGSINLSDAGPIEVLAAAWCEVRERRYGTRRWVRLSAADLARVVELASNPYDNLISSVVGAKTDHRGFARLLWLLLRIQMTDERPWWRHPRWHFWHWRIRVVPWLHFCRWAFSRCLTCGGGFRWGEAPVAEGWHSDRPGIFQRERVRHMNCSRAQPARSAA